MLLFPPHLAPIPLPADGAIGGRKHLLLPPSTDALNAACSTRRPLLVRGEPGVGKTQLAEAAAAHLGWPLLAVTVDSRTESRDLLWSFDAVGRLARAQICAVLHGRRGAEWAPDPGTAAAPDAVQTAVEKQLAKRNFLHPGILWWAFQWQIAHDQAKAVGARLWPEPPAPKKKSARKWSPGGGAVLLIDEIDKAESDVPNGLLEALGANRFQPPGWPRPVVRDPGSPLLVIITTNEERALPDPFLRRCVVLHLQLPHESDSQTEFEARLIEIGKVHFDEQTTAAVYSAAARIIQEDREKYRGERLTPLPGVAEYLDLLRAAIDQYPNDADHQIEALQVVRQFVSRKHTGLA